jgi:Tfp pilus assembly protein PilF
MDRSCTPVAEIDESTMTLGIKLKNLFASRRQFFVEERNGNRRRLISCCIWIVLAAYLAGGVLSARAQKANRQTDSALLQRLRNAQSIAHLGNVEQALALTNSLVDEHPDFAPALKLQGELFETEGRTSESCTSYQRALELLPNDTELLLKVGVYRLVAGDKQQAVKSLLLLLKLVPNDSEGLYYLAQAYQLNGNDELALRTIRKCLKFDPDNASVWQKYGEFLCNSGNYQEGLRWLLKAQQADPTLEGIDLDIGAASYNNMDLPNAVKYTAKAAELQPNNLKALTVLADAEVKLSQWQEAEAVFERILAIKKDDAYSLLGIGHCSLEMKDYASAASTLGYLLQRDPTQVLAHFYLSKAYVGLGRTADAQHEASLHNLMMEQSSFAPSKGKAERDKAIWDQARQLLADHRESDALDLLQRSAKGASASQARPYVFLAALYFTEGNVEEASRNLKRAQEIDPKVEGAHTYQGLLALRDGDLDKAENDLEAELKLDPNYQLALAELGEVRYRQGRWAEAADQLTKSKTVVPRLLYLLCDSYFRIGKVSDANLTAETLSAYGRNDPEVVQGLIDLLNRNGQAELAQRLSGNLKP